MMKDVTITSSSSGRGHLILGDNLGLVHLFDRQYQRESFKAYNVNTSHVLQLRQSPFLGTVGVSSKNNSANTVLDMILHLLNIIFLIEGR